MGRRVRGVDDNVVRNAVMDDQRLGLGHARHSIRPEHLSGCRHSAIAHHADPEDLESSENCSQPLLLASAARNTSSGITPVPLGAGDLGRASRTEFVETGAVSEGAKVFDTGFTWRGESGTVHVECVPNSDPASYGCWWPVVEGFPVCTATVNYPVRGYHSRLGWVQLVRSTDNESGGLAFELDPFGLFGDAPSPYCWYGQRPILFDAPSRPVRQPLEWAAHSFLAATPLDEVSQMKARRVVPLLGFSWGFTDTGSSAILDDVELLTDREWHMHLDALRSGYPLWVFSEGTEEEHPPAR